MIANVGSRWESGKLVFFSKVTGNTIVTFDPDNDALTVDSLAATSLELDGVTIKQAENQTDSEASDAAELLVDFNALLAKLKAAGLMEPDPEE